MTTSDEIRDKIIPLILRSFNEVFISNNVRKIEKFYNESTNVNYWDLYFLDESFIRIAVRQIEP